MSKAKVAVAITTLFLTGELIVGATRNLIAQQNNPGVQQSGAVTSGHGVIWGPGVGQIQDSGAAPSAVVSVFGRTGAVVASIGDYAFNQLSGSLLCVQLPSFTGDITDSGCAMTLATVNANVGAFGGVNSIPSFAVNAKGLITAAAANVPAIPFTEVTGQATLAQMPQLTANSIYINATNGAAQPLSTAIPACANDGVHGLVYVNGSGLACASMTAAGVISFNSLTGAVTSNVVVQVFTGTGTYTPTSGMLHAIVECIGPGGGGGGSAGSAGGIFIGGGGSSGGYSLKKIVAADIVGTATITLPNGGAGGTAGGNAGSAGTGDTTVVSNAVNLCIGKAGNGGGGASTSLVAQGGAVAVSGTGDVAAQGNAGGNGFYNSANVTTAVPAGQGGSSTLGGGAAATFCAGGATTVGGAGGNYGGGGGGGCASNTASTVAGGAGSKGIVVITEFVNL